MMIPILPKLENRQQWTALFQRERPYSQIKSPSCRVDLQTSYLQLTCFDRPKVIRYTLGSRTSLEPVWQLISRCNWSLKTLIQGLDGLDEGSSVRDKQIREWIPDLSVRRSIPREQQLYAEEPLGAWPQPIDIMRVDTLQAVCSVISWRKFEHWESVLAPLPWLLEVQETLEGWEIQCARDGTVQVEHSERPGAKFKVRI
jgi:hypothetical protein